MDNENVTQVPYIVYESEQSRGRYSSEGYSRNDDMISELNDLMNDAPDERTRQEMQKFITKMESMM